MRNRTRKPDPWTMKILLAGVIVSNLWVVHMILPARIAPGSPRIDTPPKTRPMAPSSNSDALWAAVCQVESNGNPKAIGDGGDSWGIAQISTICLRDCNRIIGYEKWSKSDRLDPRKSREMFDCYLGHYGGTVEERARKWNGGPDGHI